MVKRQEITSQSIVGFARMLFKKLSDKYGGDCTINELRVMNQVIHCQLIGHCCGVSCLSRATGIHVATVSRSVADLQNKGWLSERPDPDDGRKRILSFGPRSIDQTYDDINAAIRWLNDDREHDLPT